MRVLLCNQGEQARFVEVCNELTELQAIVEGYIEAVPFFKNTVLICNEEGRIRDDLKPNRFVTLRGEIDLINGNFLVCGTNGEEFTDLPRLAGPLIKAQLAEPHFDKNGEPV